VIKYKAWPLEKNSAVPKQNYNLSMEKPWILEKNTTPRNKQKPNYYSQFKVLLYSIYYCSKIKYRRPNNIKRREIIL
jgi:hypothetical protein